jgi:DNA-directed RNA polymerase specialized sigma24 family protein
MCGKSIQSPSSSELARIERAAAVLSSVERKVLVLSSAHGLRTREIARRLGISELRAERLLAGALCKFDRALEQEARRWWRFW